MDKHLRNLERLALSGDSDAARKLHEANIQLHGHAEGCGICLQCDQPCSVAWWEWLDHSEDVILIHATCGHKFSAAGHHMGGTYRHAIGCPWCREKHISRVRRRNPLTRNPDEDRAKKALRLIVSEYWDNPPFLRKKDLLQINKLRQQLGMLPVDADLNEIQPVDEIEPEPEPEEELEPVDIHEVARDVYEQYQAKLEAMQPHLDYAKRMLRALLVTGMTPIMPLAKMGTGGGPVVCDHCGKQFPLEGGNYNGVRAGVAWERERERLGHEPPDNWVSYISGHVNFMQEDNGTFRAYHGFDSRGCFKDALAEDDQLRKEYRETATPPPAGLTKMLHEYLQDEHSMFGMRKQRDAIINNIYRTLYSYDPGIGLNHP